MSNDDERAREMVEAFKPLADTCKRLLKEMGPAEPHCDDCGEPLDETELESLWDGQITRMLCEKCVHVRHYGISDANAQLNKESEWESRGK